MSDDRFFERLRGDAAPLRYEPDAMTVNRIAARIRERVQEPAVAPTVAELLARWFRPLAAAVTALAIAAGIGLLALPGDSGPTYEPPLEITVAGEVYRVE